MYFSNTPANRRPSRVKMCFGFSSSIIREGNYYYFMSFSSTLTPLFIHQLISFEFIHYCVLNWFLLSFFNLPQKDLFFLSTRWFRGWYILTRNLQFIIVWKIAIYIVYRHFTQQFSLTCLFALYWSIWKRVEQSRDLENEMEKMSLVRIVWSLNCKLM